MAAQYTNTVAPWYSQQDFAEVTPKQINYENYFKSQRTTGSPLLLY